MKYLPLIFLVFSTSAFAQQPRPQMIDERVGAQIGALVIQNAQLGMQLDQALAALKAAQDRVKALEEKYEPKKAGEAKPQ